MDPQDRTLTRIINVIGVTLFAFVLGMLLSALSGCENVPDTAIQADIMIATYEEYSGDVSDTQAACVHRVPVYYARHDEVRRCNDRKGCMVHGRHPLRIWIAQGLEPEEEVRVLRHEYTHVILLCVTGDSHHDHDAPEFYTPGSLVELASQ